MEAPTIEKPIQRRDLSSLTQTIATKEDEYSLKSKLKTFFDGKVLVFDKV
jgi:hypothetical protein